MKKDPRWLKAAVNASATETVNLPWKRDTRTKPEAMKTVAAARPVAKAAR